jgi:hypothetical protein
VAAPGLMKRIIKIVARYGVGASVASGKYWRGWQTLDVVRFDRVYTTAVDGIHTGRERKPFLHVFC